MTAFTAGGLELKFFESAEFEAQTLENPTENNIIIGRNVLRMLMMGWHANWTELLSWKVFKAIFIERDHALTKGMRFAFQEGFNYLFTQLEGKNLSESELNQVHLYINNCLTLLPFSDITPYESFAIPQLVNGTWQMIDYKVTPIEMTPTTGFKKLFIAEQDRVFAYGLEPIKDPDAAPHLIFMGTTYPAGQGFIPDVNTDMEAFETVGKKQYRAGHKGITAWMDKQKNLIEVCGTSLGGSLSLLAAIDKGNQISRVDALNPAGLYNPWRKSRFDHWDEFDGKEGNKKPAVYIQRQGNDPVSINGVWKEDWTLIEVTPPLDKQGPNGGTDHALNYAGFADTQFTVVDTKADNEKRAVRNFWLYTVARSLVYYFGMVPFRYTILPAFRYVNSHKMQLLLTAGLITLFCFFPIASAGLAIPLLGATALLAVNAAISGIIGGYLLTHYLWIIKDVFMGTKDSDFTKFASWFNNRSHISKLAMATVACLGIAALFAASMFALPTLLPIAPALLYAVISIPLVIAVGYKLTTIMQTLFGLNTVEAPACQSPDLARNETMDMYQQGMEAEFSLQEINDYYRAKRNVLDNKSLFPTSDHGHVKFDGFATKRAVLEKSDAAVDVNEKVKVTASTAKIYDMKQTVKLMGQFGLHSDNSGLKNDLADLQAEYESGKPKSGEARFCP